MMFAALVLLVVQIYSAAAIPTPRENAPTVQLDNATITGERGAGVEKFLGIPFAKPPIGDLRFRLPVPIPTYTESFTAIRYGLSCPQQALSLPVPGEVAAEVVDLVVNTVYKAVFPDGEDCLTLNVIKPTGIRPGTKLPVVVWIFGGGFVIGSTSLYDGTSIVQRSVEMGQPVIYMSMNYRISAFGFLGSKEVKDQGVGNLGLHDQRQALRWVKKYIGAFGGDPTKITIWGESAGAMSVAFQMITNGGNTEGLFRAGFMQSGSPIPTGDITNGQKHYDTLVNQVGCSGHSDTLQCLREVPYQALKSAIDDSPSMFSYSSLALPWLPRADGVFLKDNPQWLVQQGNVANIPFVIGNCDDEGTLFSFSSLNVTTDVAVKEYVQGILVPGATDTDMENLMKLYPSDPTYGSPFDTGILNAITPQFKRIAALQGDAVFHGPRRFFLDSRSKLQNTWSFLSKRFKISPLAGSFHTSDILNVYFGGEMADYLINFANSLDPNGQGLLQWPKYDTTTRKLMTFLDGIVHLEIGDDMFRKEGMEYLTQVTLKTPL